MRNIDVSELPEDIKNCILIKRRERTFHYKMSQALERTVTHCQKLMNENELRTIEINQKSQKDGFAAGFEQFFSLLITMLDEYSRVQNERFELYRRTLLNEVQSSLREPVIVQHIVHRLQEKSGQQKALKIIIPRGITLPENTDMSNYLFSDGDDITVENQNNAIRFPARHLFKKWQKKADDELLATNDVINNIIPDFLQKIGSKFLEKNNHNRDCRND